MTKREKRYIIIKSLYYVAYATEWRIKMFETLKSVLVEELQINEDIITPDAELASDLGINSIELADLVMICEEKFDISIEDEDLHKFITVGDVVNYLESRD